MKKLISTYKAYMVRPTVYKGFSKAMYSLVFVLGLQVILPDAEELLSYWDRCFIIAVLLLAMAWISYLRLDGVGKKLPKLPKRERKKKFWQNDIVDFVDEHVVVFDELGEDEQYAVSFVSSAIIAVLYLIPAIIGTIVTMSA